MVNKNLYGYVINFKIYKINRGEHKLAWIPR